jgi:hypothetical protein
MAIYIDAISVIPSDTLNIPKPGIITSGTNSTVGTVLTDAAQDFLNSTTNTNGYNISGGDVVYAGGAIDQIEAVRSDTTLTMSTSTAAAAFDIYKGNVDGDSGFSLYITGAGDVSVVTVEGTAIVIPMVANSILDLQVIRVNATGTTATGIIALEVK